jgi:hypothetical protein
MRSRTGRSSRRIQRRSCYTALAPPAKDNFDILSMALASETPLRNRTVPRS